MNKFFCWALVGFGLGFAQQFSKPPIIAPIALLCDEVQFLFTSRNAKCTAWFAYQPDPTVGLLKVQADIVEEWVNSAGQPQKSIREQFFFWAKTTGNIVAWPLSNPRRFIYAGGDIVPGLSNDTWEFTVRQLRNEDAYLLPFGFNYRLEPKTAPASWLRLRIKLTLRFANGIEYLRELAIPIK